MEKINAVVQKIIPQGNHGPFAVATSEDIDGSITFSLEPTVWQENEQPEQGMIVVLSELRKKRAGWRAKKGRFLNPSDEQTEIRNQERSKEMKEKIKKLLLEGWRRDNDAFVLQKTANVKLDSETIESVLDERLSDKDYLPLESIINVSKIFKFKIPKSHTDRIFKRLIEYGDSFPTSKYTDIQKFMRVTRQSPDKSLVEDLAKKSPKGRVHYDDDIKAVRQFVAFCKNMNVSLPENTITEIFHNALQGGNVKLIKKIETILGQNPDYKQPIFYKSIQAGYVQAFEYCQIDNVKALHKHTLVAPTQGVVQEMYEKSLREFNHTRCCGDLLGSERVIPLIKEYGAPKYVPERVYNIVEEIFFYRSPELFFGLGEFRACFPGLKLRKGSELANKIEKECQKIVDVFMYADEVINYLYIVKEGLDFTPSISAESIAKIRHTLKSGSQYKLLEKLNAVFPE